MVKNTLGRLYVNMIFLIFLMISIPCYSYQPEKGRVNLSTGPFIFNGDLQFYPDKYYPRPKIGWGLVAEAILGEKTGLEIGLFYFDKPYLRQEGSSFLIQKIKRIYITTGYRHWASPFFSVGVHLFSSFSMGDVVNVDSSLNLPSDFMTLAERDITNYGIDFSWRFEIPFSKREDFFVDVRYSLNLSAEPRDEANHLGIGFFYSKEIEIK